MNKLCVLILFATQMITGCCDPITCNEKQIDGLIPLDSSNLKITQFHRDDTLSFVNSNGARFNFRYSSIRSGKQSNPVNCIFGGCDDVCCDYVDSEFRAFSLNGIILPNSIKITLTKRIMGMATPDTTLGDVLSIRHTNVGLDLLIVDGQIKIDSINAQKHESINLLGHLFYDVYSNIRSNYGDTLSAYPRIVYFNKALGVVGWSLFNGEIWSLE